MATEKLLRVTAPGMCAGAIFEKIDDEWYLVRCAPILRWMENSTIENIGHFFNSPTVKRRGWTYEWIETGP